MDAAVCKNKGERELVIQPLHSDFSIHNIHLLLQKKQNEQDSEDPTSWFSFFFQKKLKRYEDSEDPNLLILIFHPPCPFSPSKKGEGGGKKIEHDTGHRLKKKEKRGGELNMTQWHWPPIIQPLDSISMSICSCLKKKNKTLMMKLFLPIPFHNGCCYNKKSRKC